MATAPEYDCPKCPGCGDALGTPLIRNEVERWYGPLRANLFCPACGTGWVGTEAEMAPANRAQDAWEAIEKGTQ